MLALYRTKSLKSAERIDFKFSKFKAIQVPEGWDKLFVSLFSVETGKSIAKLNKAVVSNGKCQWTESLSESVWVAPDESTKELEDCLFRLLVAMGSARSGILGEVTVNMASYMGSSASVPVSLPLKRCNHGTILQFKIQCLTPKAKQSDDEPKEINSSEEDINENSSDDDEVKSEASDGTMAKTAGFCPNGAVVSSTNQEENGQRTSTSSSSGSHHSYDSERRSTGRSSFSRPSNNLQNNAPRGSYHSKSTSQSSRSSFDSRSTNSESLSQDEPQEFPAAPLRVSKSSKSMLEAAEDTIEDLREESKMWERNATKLMLDLDMLKRESLEQSKIKANLDMELSAACAERDGLQKEVQKLKSLLEEQVVKPEAIEASTSQEESVTQYIKELENENKFQKESNANLTLQLNRSQKSNVELVSVLQELEEIVEKQKVEIESLYGSDLENSIKANSESTNLMLQIQQLQESEKDLQAKVEALEEKNQSVEAWSLKNWNLKDIREKSQQKLSANEKEVVPLEGRYYAAEMKCTNGSQGGLIKEIEALNFKLQELERDFQEVTNENIQLLLSLEETKCSSMEGNISFINSSADLGKDEAKLHNLEGEMRKIENYCNFLTHEPETEKSEVEIKVKDFRKELDERRAEIERLKAGLLSKEEEVANLQKNERELEAKLSFIQEEKDQLEENMECIKRESDIATRCLNDMRNDLMVLSSTVNSHVSANKILERKASELESDRRELEHQSSELRQEKEELSARLSGLESKLRHLTDERESTAFELENTKSHAVSLQVEIARLKNEMEIQTKELKQNLHEMHSQWLEAQEERKYLRKENVKLKTMAESLEEELSLLQESNGELQRQNLELQECCNQLEVKLTELHRNVAESSERVKVLEEEISSILEDSTSKEKSLTLERDALREENGKQKKKLSLVNQKYLEKMTANENLEREVEGLTKQLSATQDERDRIASDALHKESSLHAEIAKLELDFNTSQIESEAKIQALMNELAAFKQNQDTLKVDNGRMDKLLESYKSHEEKFKTSLNDLELKLTVCEYERHQIIEESTSLKAQLLEIDNLQDEVLALKNELNSSKLEKGKLETSLHLISEECETLKAEKDSFLEMITTLRQGVCDLKDCRENRIALERELLRMDGDITAKEVLIEQNTGLKDELSRIKRTNTQLQQQIKQLEEEKEESRTRVLSLEGELILIKEKSLILREPSSIDCPNSSQQREVDNGYGTHDESLTAGTDPASKIRILEEALAKAMQSNKLYRAQLKKLTSEERKGHAGSSRRSAAEEKSDRPKSSAETELKDLQERYFHMSLKYAEVEAQREELVMKLKAVNTGKKWF